jgi:uncharacterized protein (DUF433 family)
MPEEFDWSKCEDVESVPGRLSGTWVIKGTRVPTQAVVDNARAGCTAEEIATEVFELLLERVSPNSPSSTTTTLKSTACWPTKSAPRLHPAPREIAPCRAWGGDRRYAPSCQNTAVRCRCTSSNSCRPRSCVSSRWQKRHTVVSSGTGSWPRSMPTKSRIASES